MNNPFEEAFSNLDKTEVQQSSFMNQPDVCTVQIMDASFEKNLYNKEPIRQGLKISIKVIQSAFHNQEGKTLNYTYVFPAKDMSEKGQEIKAKQLKEFFYNSIQVETLKGHKPSELIQKLKGSKIKAVIVSNKNWKLDKNNNNKPVERDFLEILFTKPVSESLTYSQEKLFRGMSDYNKKKYEDALESWNEKNVSAGTIESMPNATDNTDISFDDDDDELVF